MAAKVKLSILCEDADLVAIDKPSGIPAIPGRNEAESIIEILSAQLNLPFTGLADPRLRVVHRIDKDTSGVMVFAKNSPAQRGLSYQCQSNTIEKEYLALVAGAPKENEGLIDAPLGQHPTSAKRMAVVKHGGRPARTSWKVEQRFRTYTLIRAFPKTGKTHQIRVHLAYIGLPLAIDPIYNPRSGPILLSSFKHGYRRKPGQEERPLIERLTLHAHQLTFQSAESRKQITSELPKDFRTVLNMLGKYSA